MGELRLDTYFNDIKEYHNRLTAEEFQGFMINLDSHLWIKMKKVIGGCTYRCGC
jgi:hypothetical protein